MSAKTTKMNSLFWQCRVAIVASLFLAGSIHTVIAAQSKCLYVSSYHKGYAWSDGVEEGLRSALSGKCELRQFDMDTKRQKTDDHKIRAAREANEIINTWKPDIVITSDDNAAKYLIVPFHHNSEVPFVFSGVNWTVEEYGFPFRNVTGIVEVAPIEPMLEKAMEFSGGTSAVYIGAKTLTEEKNFSRISKGAEKLGVTLEKRLVSTFDEWLSIFKQSQASDFLVMGSNSGIDNWNESIAEETVVSHSRIISVTNHEWMMNVSLMGFTKIPQEHGEWAAEAALAILAGTPVTDIPIVTNRKWDLWLNSTIADGLETPLPGSFTQKAKKLAMTE